MADRYQAWIEGAAEERPQLAAALAELGELYHKKLWHQLSVKLEQHIEVSDAGGQCGNLRVKPCLRAQPHGAMLPSPCSFPSLPWAVARVPGGRLPGGAVPELCGGLCAQDQSAQASLLRGGGQQADGQAAGGQRGGSHGALFCRIGA